MIIYYDAKKNKMYTFNRDLVTLIKLPFTTSKTPFIISNKILGKEMTTSIIKISATVTSVSNINFRYLKSILVRTTIISTGNKIMYQSLESIIRIIFKLGKLEKTRLTRRTDVNFVKMLL